MSEKKTTYIREAERAIRERRTDREVLDAIDTRLTRIETRVATAFVTMGLTPQGVKPSAITTNVDPLSSSDAPTN